MSPKKKRSNEFLDALANRKPLSKLSRYAVRNDRYDREDVARLLREIREFRSYRDKLADSKVGPDLAYDAWQDTLLSLLKVEPKLTDDADMRPDHRVARRVQKELSDLSEHKELRTYTVGDDIGSAMACNLMEPNLERIYERLDAERRHEQALQEIYEQLAAAQAEARDTDEMLEAWTAEHPDENPDELEQRRKELQEQLDQLMQDAQASEADLEEMLRQATPEIRELLRAGARDAANQARGMENLGSMWGMEPGELQRLPAADRLELARRFNTPKFQRMAELFGPMKRLALSEQRRRVNYVPEEIFEIEQGNDVRRLLPMELLKFVDEFREMQFLLQWRRRSLLQFAKRGYERIARGGIVYVYDGSGSMHGEKEIWSKAVGICLLHIARKQKREFVAIQFGSRHQIMMHDFRDGDISHQRVLDFAEFFFNGGTDFETPLDAALAVLNDEHDRTGALRSDIVFLTDGECDVSPPWMKHWEDERERLAFTCWGVNLDGDFHSQPQYSICGGRIATIASIQNGNDVREIFHTI